MSKRYDVVWLHVAKNDLKNIIGYIAYENLPYTLKLFKNIKQKASSFYVFPEKGCIVPELRDQGISQYCELVISPWRILYRISEKSAFVLSVLDSRQNIEDILLKRLIDLKIQTC